MRLVDGDEVVNAVADGVVQGVVGASGVTLETLFLLLQWRSKVKGIMWCLPHYTGTSPAE